MSDLIEFEKVGLPTVGLTARGFEADVELTARAFGLPQLPYAVIPYTLTSRSREQARDDVEHVIGDIVEALSVQPDAGAAEDIPSADNVEEAEREVFTGADRLEAWEKFNGEFLDREWGDGFPLIGPTPERVDAFLASTTRGPLDILGALAPGNGIATVEKLAINTAMAGCEPEHFPVLISAVEAMIDTPENVFPIRSIATSTSPNAFMMLLNGPVVKELGVAYGRCALGPGKPGRVNTALGRALRLIMMNVGQCYPGRGDLDTIGSPLKYSMCIAENEDQNPWEPFHVERGLRPDQSAVTVFGTNDVIHMADYNHMAGPMLTAWASRAAAAGGSGAQLFPSRFEMDESHSVMLVSPDHARILSEQEFTKKTIRQSISREATRPLKWILANVTSPEESIPPSSKWILDLPPDTPIPAVPNPDSLHIVVVGGPTGKSDYVRLVGAPTVTREIDSRVEQEALRKQR